MTAPTAPRFLSRLLLAGGLTVGVSGVAGLGGCRAQEDPSGYSRQRPPADRLDSRDRGLQSFDVEAAAEQMAQSILSNPQINASPTRLTVVVDRVDNETMTHSGPLDIFIRRLRVELARRGSDRIQLIENRARLRELQSRELETGGERETFGGARPLPGPAGIQPDYSLFARVSDLPGRGTNFYLFEFTLTNLQTREQVWTDGYEVRVAR